VLLAACAGVSETAALPRPEPAAAAGATAGGVSDSSLAALEGRPIRSVSIVTGNIFDPVPHGHLHAFYQLSNQLHVRTRESTVRALLLIQPGDRWSRERAAETMRRLRELDFLVPDWIEPHSAGDSVDVVVHTTDAWTTSPEFDYQSTDAAHYLTVAFAEGNLLGLGKGVGFSYHEEPNGVTRAFDWSDPTWFGTRARLDVALSRGALGNTNHIDGGIPFYAPSTPTAVFTDWKNTTAIGRLYSHGFESTNFDEQRKDSDILAGRGHERNGTVTRWIASFHSMDRHLGPSYPVGTAPVPPAFDGASEDLVLRRIAIEGQWWRPRFIERIGVNRMTRIEDFDIGTRFALKVGLAPRAFGSTATEGYVRTVADAGLPAGNAFGLVHAAFETRYRRTVRDEVASVSGRVVAPITSHQTVVLAGFGATGYQVARDFQLIAGGLSGLRGYPVYELAGRRLLRLNAEHRMSGPELWELMSLGTAVFFDAAHMSGAGAEGTQWRSDAGFGLRIGLPRSALNQVVRFDLAFPISPARDGRHHVVFSFGSSQAF